MFPPKKIVKEYIQNVSTCEGKSSFESEHMERHLKYSIEYTKYNLH